MVRLGKKAGIRTYILMITSAYLLILLCPLLGLMPWTVLISLPTALLAVKGKGF